MIVSDPTELVPAGIVKQQSFFFAYEELYLKVTQRAEG